MDLQTKLIVVADLWVAANRTAGKSATLATLSSRATSDGKLFRRLEAGRPIYVSTLERVLSYLADQQSWPSSDVPVAAARLLKSPILELQL